MRIVGFLRVLGARTAVGVAMARGRGVAVAVVRGQRSAVQRRHRLPVGEGKDRGVLGRISHGADLVVGLVAGAGAVVHVQAEEGEGNAGALDPGGWAAEPDEGDGDDEDALEQAGDGVGDGGDHGQQLEGDDVLAKVERAVEDELENQAAVVEALRPLVQVNGPVVQEVAQHLDALGPEPDGGREDESQAGRVAEEVQLIELAGLGAEPLHLGLGGLVEQALGHDVLGDEDEGGGEGVEDAEELAAKGVLAGAGEHDAEGEGHEGDVGGDGVAYVVDEAVGEHGEEWGEALDGVDEGHGDEQGRVGAEQVAADLEQGEGQRRLEDVPRRGPDRVLERGDGGAQVGKGRGDC